jgi:radical SAM protein with 4Fe4S-binding SPASM domain
MINLYENIKGSRAIKNILKLFIYKTPFCFFYDYLYSRLIQRKIKKLELRPRHTDIETTNLCNASCIMCPRTKMTRKQGVMSFETFQKIIDYCLKNNIKSILLSVFGEPLIDKGFFDKIKYAKARGIEKVSFFTNGSLMNEECQEQIIQTGVDVVAVSIDASSREKYNNIRRNLDFDIVVKNIEELAKKKKDKPRIKLIYTSMDLNQEERSLFIKRWQPVVDEVEISVARTWSGDVNVSPPEDKKIIFSRRLFPCIELWNVIIFLWNGDVVFCCNDYDGKYILGNIHQDDASSFWQGSRLNQLRQLHRSGQSEKMSICRNCTMHLRGNKINWWRT